MLLDLMLPHRDGLRVLSRLKSTRPDVAVLVLSGTSEPAVVQEALFHGANGYLDKRRDRADICAGVLAALHGGVVATSEVRAAQSLPPRDRPAMVDLSDRELEVLRLCADGMLAPQIATRLDIAVSTVRTHLARLYRKLGTPDRASAVAKAVRMGLLRLEPR